MIPPLDLWKIKLRLRSACKQHFNDFLMIITSKIVFSARFDISLKDYLLFVFFFLVEQVPNKYS